MVWVSLLLSKVMICGDCLLPSFKLVSNPTHKMVKTMLAFTMIIIMVINIYIYNKTYFVYRYIMNFSLSLYYYVIIIIIIIIVIIIFIIVSFIIILIVTLVVYSKTENVKVSINLPVGMEYIFLFADFLSQL